MDTNIWDSTDNILKPKEVIMDDRIKKPYEFDLQKLFETVGNKETDFDSFVNYQFEADMKKISTISELDFILKNLKEWLVKGISRSREMGKYRNMLLVTWFVMMLCCSIA